MARWNNFYLIRIEFLGFRYHGWQVQPGLKSVEGMMNKTFEFIFQHQNFKVLGCGRTDAKVSANDFPLELFLNEKINPSSLLHELNKNLPFDIRAKSVKEIDANFNIIQHSKIKEYHYYFSFGEKSHPFNAPFMINYEEQLDITIMQKAVQAFIGTHNFKRFACKPNENTNLEREILTASIEKNTTLIGSFTPKNSYVFKISAKGFLRYQVRLMMGALIQVGKKEWSIEDLKNALINYEEEPISYNAPSSGLTLYKVTF